MSGLPCRHIITLGIGVLMSSVGLGQLTIIEKFDKLFLSENFDSSNVYWNTVSNADNLLIVQEGEYIMHRKTTVSPYALMGNFTNDLSVFKLITSLKFDKTSAPDGSIGVIFMAQPDGKGGFIFEINKDSYRLRQINGGSYKYLSGTAKNSGWVQSNYVKGLNLPNLVEIRSSQKKYDLLLNNNYLMGFSEPAYTSGNFGFIIGPASKGKADFLYLFTTIKDNLADNNPKTDDKKDNAPETDVSALAESIITLKTQINRLSEDNDDLKQIIQALRSGEKENEKEKANYEKQIKELDTRIKKSSGSYDSLMKINGELMRYKEMVMGNDNGDLVINLSKNLKKEKANSDELLKTNKLLTDSLSLMKNELKVLKGNKDATVNIQKNKSAKDSVPEKKPEKKEFVLPKEN